MVLLSFVRSILLLIILNIANNLKVVCIHDVHEAHKLSILEVGKAKFELSVLSNLEIKEYGTFDFASPLNGRSIRMCGVLVPRDIEIYFRILSSPVFHQRPYNLSLPADSTLLQQLGLSSDVVFLSENDPVYKVIVCILRNEISVLRYIKDHHKSKQTWPTYLDNKAAYANLWHNARNLFKVKLPLYSFIDDSNYVYYITNDGKYLKYKYKLKFDYNKYQNLALLLGYWNTDVIKLRRYYINNLESLLNDVDRSNYPMDFFEILDGDVDIIKGIEWTGGLSWDEAMLIESRRIAKISIRLLYHVLHKMLNSHGINGYKIQQTKNKLYHIRLCSDVLLQIRTLLNHYTLNIKMYKNVKETPVINEDVEELLFESVPKYSMYWNVKNDSLYNRNSLHDMTIEQLTASVLDNLKFEPNSFYNELGNISGEEVDFKRVYDILLMLTQGTTDATRMLFNIKRNTSNVVTDIVDIVNEQYKALPNSLNKLLRARSKCLMAFLYLFGVPDKKGRLKFPYGWPRDDKRAIKLLISGMGSKCGLCNSILGFLSAIGYPPISNNMFAWEMKKNNDETTVYQLLASNIFDDNEYIVGRKGFDLPLLSYLSGSYKHDEISSLAYGYYIYSGISNVSRTCEYSSHSSINRPLKDVGSRCLDAIPYIIDAAKYAMKNRQTDQYQEASDEYKSKKYAEFVKKLAKMGDSDGLRMLGDFYYAGHEEGGIRRDYQQALHYWRLAADNGDASSALAVAHHHITLMNDDNDHSYHAERYLRMIINSSANNSSTAKFYLARYGLGQPKDPILAARWLRESADRGDVNSQVLMGHAFAGILNDVTPAEGKNIFMSFYYYRRAANNGNIVGLFNSAVFTLHGYDLGYDTPHSRCNAAFKLFSKVGRMGTIPYAIKSLSKRFKQFDDHIGYALTNMFLSEFGDPIAHENTSKYFKFNNNLCFIPNNEIIQDNKLNLEDGDDGTINNPCHYYYSRRSAYDHDSNSPLLLAEALVSGIPWDPIEALKWAKESNNKNDVKGSYMYATMLEAGLGTTKNCNEAFLIFKKLLNSKIQTERILGLLCIIRSKIISFFKNHNLIYSIIVHTLYDKYAIHSINHDNYTPCNFPLLQERPIVINGIRLITIVYTLILILVIFVYIKTIT